ncbi:MAG: RluA family pseudouridine synthase [Syntrophales bacterium]|nr:RluA family pseudouridine synthase [Syntrophales bacterium]
MSEKYTFIVACHESGLRLDIFLSRKDLTLSRSQIKRAVDEGLVLVNDLKVKAGYKLRNGDTVHLCKKAAASYHVLPQKIPLTIVYEDPFLLVVDKPAGMVVHPAPGHDRGTLVNALLFHCKDLSGIGGVLRPGIIHRLDKGTSGLLVVAKSDEAHRGLAAQFKKHQVQKSYKVLVYGDVEGDQGMIDASVGRHPVDRKKMSTRSRRGREAITRWRVSKRYRVATLLDVDTETGRTHQIRVHLNAMSYPVVGDNIYGSSRRVGAIGDPLLRAEMRTMTRQALHASRIAFSHPINNAEMTFSSPMPDDMARLCDFLRRRNHLV